MWLNVFTILILASFCVILYATAIRLEKAIEQMERTGELLKNILDMHYIFYEVAYQLKTEQFEMPYSEAGLKIERDSIAIQCDTAEQLRKLVLENCNSIMEKAKKISVDYKDEEWYKDCTKIIKPIIKFTQNSMMEFREC